MDKSKSKKKDGKASGGTKVTKKKATTQKKSTDNKSSKKKKGAKGKGARDENNDLDLQNKAETPSLSVIDQKENQKLEEKLNQPLTRKKLPPINRNANDPNNNENNEMEDYIGQEEEVKEEEKIEENKEAEKEKPETVELSIGTPYFYNITGLNSDLDEKNKKISEENSYQEKYKLTLKNLLNDLNVILAKNVELLYSEENEETKKQKQENMIYLQNIIYSYQQRVKDSIEKNKRYKEQYESLLKKDNSLKIENAKEYETLIEEKKINNSELNKKIIELKSESFKKKNDFKKDNFKVYNGAGELQKLSQKKADYLSKIAKSKKTLSVYQRELANLVNILEEKKEQKNYFNAKVEEDINRLKEDLAGNEDEILERIENDKAFILRKVIHQEKVKSVFKPQSPKVNDTKKLQLKKSLEPINRKAIRYDVSSTYNSRRYNIVSKMKSPIKAKVNTRGDIFEDDLSKIEYDNLTEYEYRELKNKIEQSADVIKKLKTSITEAQKMYSRKLKDIKATLDENSKKLSSRKKENELLKNNINDLMKIYELTEKEAKIHNSNNINNNNLHNSTKGKNNNNNNVNDEKELESHKEYLSPDYYQPNKNKKEKDKVLIPAHSNNDLTGNDSLGLNIEGDQGGNKLNNIKFPDLSNIEEDKGDKMIMNNNNNQYDRSKAIDDIKKKYNIKKSNIEEIDNLGIDENDLNFNDENEDKLRKEQGEMMDKESEDEKKFFEEHEKIMKGEEEEGQFEPPIENEIKIDNNNENNENENNNAEGNNNEDEIISNENEKKDQDEVNYRKNDEKENENEKENEENKRRTNYEQEQQHLVDINIEGTKNENEDNLKEEENNIEKKDDEFEDNNINNEKEKNENEINEENNNKEEENEINNDADHQDSVKELDVNEKEVKEKNKENAEMEENNQNEEKEEKKENEDKEEKEENKEIMNEEKNENEIKAENENENKKEDNNEENNEQEVKEENNEGQKENEENKTDLKLETNQNKEDIENKEENKEE